MKATADESQDIEGFAVHPLGVVAYHQQRLPAGGAGEEGQNGQSHQEAIGDGTGCHTQGRLQRQELGPRQICAPVQERQEQSVDGCEAEFLLRLSAGESCHAQR